VTRASTALARLPRLALVLRSPLYRTQPLGEVVQPAFVNAVAGLLTQLTPEDCWPTARLERELGREPPRERWGPRLIDLDLLVLGARRAPRDADAAASRHRERDFVLYPLADIAPDLDVPGLGRVARCARAWRIAAIERL
jgi:2-amino-4-hydroxy-6-hydroxymethyldihydropteridine diphosphokinase